MPVSKTKTKGKGGDGGGKKGAKVAAEKEEIVKLTKAFLKCYQQRCLAAESTPSPRLCRELRNCIEDEVALSKFVLDASQGIAPRPPLPSSRAASRGPSAATAGSTATAAPPTTAAKSKEVTSTSTNARPLQPPVFLLQPLINSWAEVKYTFVQNLHLWSIELADDAIVSLALFFESRLGPNIKVLELREVKLSSWAVNRLSKIDCSALNNLCENLQRVVSLTSLSLNFCQLEAACGEPLGLLTATSQIKELSLIGNRLECDGFNEFFRPLVSLADAHISLSSPLVPEDTTTPTVTVSNELESSQPQSQPAEAPPLAPPPMPPLTKLYLQDNCIDIHGACTDMDGVFASVICMRTLRRYLISSPLIEEVNLEGNWIGEGGAREVMVAVQQRKEAGLPALKMSVSPRICPEIFSQIMELNPSSGKKKKKGKGKKAKKKKK